MRRRLGLVALAVASLIVIAFSLPLGALVRDLARDRALAGAERDAQLIALFVTADDGDPVTIRRIVADGTVNGNDLSVVLRELDDTNIIIGAPLFAGENLDRFFGGVTGRLPVQDGEAFYVPAIAAGRLAVVRIFVDGATLSTGVVRAWMVLGLLGLTLIAIAVAIAYSLARNIVRPVEDLSIAAAQLGDGELSTRVDLAGPPEIRQVGAEFNRLAEQIGNLLEAERETAADLSHRLRTPLAAMNLDVERLPGGADRERLLDDLSDLQRSINYVIEETRRPSDEEVEERTDLGAVLIDRMAFWEPLAEEQNRTTHITTPDTGGPFVPVSSVDLEATVDALLGNVFAHTDEGVSYEVRCDGNGDRGRARLIVDDAGTGFSATRVQRGQSGGGSTGLGLDIVRRTAEATGGSFSIGASPLGGARLVVVFGSD